MLIRFFRSGFFIQHFVIVIVALLLWLPAYSGQGKNIEFGGFQPLFDIVYPFFIGKTMISMILMLVLFLSMAFFFGRIVSDSGFQLRTGTHAMLLFVLVSGSVFTRTGFSPWFASMPFLLAVLYHLLTFYNSKNLAFTVFYASFYSGLSALFNMPNMLLFPIVFLSLIVARSNIFRIWLVPFTGFLAPFFFLAVYYFLTDNLFIKWDEFLKALMKSTFSFHPIGIAEWLQSGVLLLLSVASFFWFNGPSADNSIIMRKRNAILLLLFFALIPINFMTTGTSLSVGIVWIVPIIFIAGFFSHTKKLRWANIGLLMLLIFTIAQQYIDFLWAR